MDDPAAEGEGGDDRTNGPTQGEGHDVGWTGNLCSTTQFMGEKEINKEMEGKMQDREDTR